MFTRHIFTDKPTRKETMLDYALAVGIASVLLVLAMAYFDVLFM